MSPPERDAAKRRKFDHFPTSTGDKHEKKNARDLGRRLLIYDAFVSLWGDEGDAGTAPAEASWGKRRTGAIAKVCTQCNLDSGNYATVCRRVFWDVLHCKENGLTYDGSDGRKSNGGENKTIKPGSLAEQMACDLYEQGFSLRDTTDALNEFWETAYPLLPHFGRSAVRGALQRRSDSRTTAIGSRKTGSFNPSSNWARARFGWVTQLLIRFGKTPPGFDLAWLLEKGLVPEGTDTIPDKFNVEKLPPLDITRVAFWDETHRKCKPGKGSRRGHQTRFKRNQGGKLDAVRGTYADRLYYVQAKYEDESRLAAGVCITVEDGEEKGTRLPAWDYTGRTIMTIPCFQEKREAEMARVRGLKDGRGWKATEGGAAAGGVFLTDPVADLASVSSENGAAEALAEAGISDIQDLIEMDLEADEDADDSISRLAYCALRAPDDDEAGGDSPGEMELKEFQKEASRRCLMSREVDYRTGDNPYKEKHGEGTADVQTGFTEYADGARREWEQIIDRVTAMKRYVCITEMIEHMMEVTEAAYAGTDRPDEWYVYHDALSLMTADETRKWMEKKDYLKRWIVPLHGLNDDISSFGLRPPGNSPELMPMDAYVNRYWHEAVKRHVNWCRGMDDKQKIEWKGRDVWRTFSDSTPARQTEGYLRLWDQDSDWDVGGWILKDIRRFLTACSSILAEDGSVVHNCSVRNGHRALWHLPENKPQRGGFHPKGLPKETRYRHRDVPLEQVSKVCTDAVARHAHN
jgi:hypothetical protein